MDSRKIEILGSGCEKCKALAANVQAAADKLGAKCEITKVTDIGRITAYGVMMTPALVIDGKVVSTGKVLSPEEASAFLRQGAPASSARCCCGGNDEAPKVEGSCCCSKGKGGKNILTVVLLAFVAASVAFVLAKEIRGKGGNAAVPAEAQQLPVRKDVMTVYYFHGTQRCMTCNRIEQLARAVIESKFAEALKDGRVIFQSVNIDEPVNAHFVQDFQLATRTVVMQRNGRFEKFDDVWMLVHEPDKFAAYIQGGAEKMLSDAK